MAKQQNGKRHKERRNKDGLSVLEQIVASSVHRWVVKAHIDD
jgi:hypothetical protein